jgi:hypothetical protein
MRYKAIAVIFWRMRKILSAEAAKKIWMRHQGLHKSSAFGSGPKGALKAIRQLGFVQIDTINVIERAHHHILWSRVPNYRTQHLVQLQSKEKSVFEYWSHVLSYFPTESFYFHRLRMEANKVKPNKWYSSVSAMDRQRLLERIEVDGPISIRDITDDVLVEKDHEWSSKKPSKKVLQLLFNRGELVISERQGMLKKYELTERHFETYEEMPIPTEEEVFSYKLERELRAQGIVSIQSMMPMTYKADKVKMEKLIRAQEKEGRLVSVQIPGLAGEHWMAEKESKAKAAFNENLVHILSPFDPLVYNRKRFHFFFNHDYRFEAYLPKNKRTYGYFALPVLVGSELVALIDMKAERDKDKLLIQQWTWMIKKPSRKVKNLIEDRIGEFEKFQFNRR